MNNVLTQFIIEAINRLGQKQPLFFKIITWIATLAAALTGLPGALALLGITLPAPWDALANKTVAIAAIVAAFTSKPSVSQATVIAAEEPTKLPLTAANTVTTKAQDAAAKKDQP